MSKFWSEIVHLTDPYVPGEQPKQQNIIKLNTNENPYPPSPKVLAALREGANEYLRLYPSPTVDELLQAAAKQFAVSPDQVFVGNGSDEVLAFAFLAFFTKGEVIRFPDITYSFYSVYAKLYGLEYEEVPLLPDFTIPVEQFFDSEGGVIFPNPNAPTGVYLPLAAVEEVLVHNPNKVVIIDEAYIDFGGESAIRLINQYDNLLVIQTLSKSRSLAGLRIGFAFGNKELIEGLNRIKNSFNSYTIDRLAIIGAVAALEDTVYFAETREKIICSREKVAAQLQLLGFTILESKANFLFIKHNLLPAEVLYTKLKEKGIFVRYFNKPRICEYIRLTIGNEEEMDRFIHEVKVILHT
ncbi:histidinol-phosphate transaminase [Caldibacillus lycopersici]|uniref:Histidinol-phosphate aminotransferase n=1 Tax=Perspicuibacillus lycopersici TaxID=1325689 RepID=A0AAE3ITA9_9BACI|nr:histidinol-phosphate transaminase [Perspicuibacillus lycopersici]MCU9613787.1 histidinol-phosphate transaminase [Perspicuibacillus lycopersici]